MATFTAFQDTRKLFRESTGYTKPLSFDEWNLVPREKKSAVLFCQFYNEITLAWDKANAYDFIPSEDGVSTMCQYLEKNVPIIENNPKRFTAAYVYKVAYNCLYCICHDRKCDQDRWNYETSNIVIYDGEELNLFDTVPDQSGSTEEKLERAEFAEEFWQIIEDLGQAAKKVMRYLSSNDEADLKKLNPRSKRYADDPLRDVEVTLEEAMFIISELRRRFAALPENSSCKEYIARFSTVA